MKRRLILHVGLHKTGASYLQQWLHRNAAALAARGVLYPDWYMKMPNANHHPFADRLAADTDYAALAAELAALPGPHGTIILSSEKMCSLFHRSRPTAAAAMAAFSPYFDITVAIYLRRQDEMLERVFAETAKTSKVDVAGVLNRPMDWHDRVEYMREVFGTDQVQARPFHPPAWLDGHFARDFLATVELGRFDDAVDIEWINEAMTRRKTLFLASIEKRGIPNLSLFLEQVRGSKAIADDGVRHVMPPAQRREILAGYRDSNINLCRASFGGAWTDHFLTPADDDDTWFPPAPIAEDERHAFAMEVWHRAMRAESKLRQADGT